MTQTITAAVEPNNSPPRVKITVTTDEPANTASIITRIHPDGSQYRIRTTTGDTLQLPGGTGIVYDYEAPFGVPVYYQDLERGTSSMSSTVTLVSSAMWLTFPGVPDLSQRIELRVGSFDEDSRPVTAGVFEVLGRENAVVITDGQRKSSSSQLVIGTDTLPQFNALMTLLNLGQTLLLNVPSSLGLGIDTTYIHCGNVRVKRPSSVGSDPHRDVVIDYREVSQPVGGAIQQRSYADVLVTYATYSALAAAPAYSSLL